MSTLAKKQLNDILDFVEEEYGQQTARKILLKMEQRLHRLAIMPEIGTLDAHLSTKQYIVRHLLIAPNVFYYIHAEDSIIIGAIVHFKQSPQTVATIIQQFLNDREK